MNTFSYDKYDVSHDYVKAKQYDFDSVNLYFNEIKKIPLLSKEEEYDLLVKAKSGDIAARNKLIESNLRLVVYVVKRSFIIGVPFQDLIQEGNLGLKKAIDGYDLNSNNRFATYAMWWIKQSISRAVETDSRTIRIPAYLFDRLKTYQKQKEQLEFEKCKSLSTYEISLELGIPLKEVETNEKLLHDAISFDFMVQNEDEDSVSELSMFIRDEENVEEKVIDSTLKEELLKCIRDTNLSMKEVYVLIKRYGLNGEEPLTLEQVANLLSLNKQRVNQIELKALKKLNNERNRKRLNLFVHPYDEVILDKKENKVVFDKSMKNLSEDLKTYFVGNGLTLNEIKVLALSLGLIDGVEQSNQEISEMLNTSLSLVRRDKKRALAKIKEHQRQLRKM